MLRVYADSSLKPSFDLIALEDEDFDIENGKPIKACVPFSEKSIEVKAISVENMTELLFDKGRPTFEA